ncbi:cyclin-dependent kinase 20-like isoform X1 [Cimex lectularius]|uniref:Cyclin-dependent kinase 20 n=1 Tax=Cimex lectularius TaxID=79782 RepID=A0A8I6RE81_CIMLE|nr:cyclin-dependent kinase 20-like isoform X1 [Cimex lectularius]XP_014240820.1 cyclin-dependent kinase 20-like isoform X1 [Cimex lectularius]
MENYEVIGRIGEGAHGYVLHAKNKTEDKEVALKKVLVKKLEEGIPRLILREIKTMQALECKYIMKLIEYFPQGAGVIMVFDYMPSGLWEMIHDREVELDQPLIKSYMHMLLQGLSYMHENNIMHRDLKPANLLISKEGILKIGDFGQARLLWLEKDRGKPYTQQVSTRWYRAPELLYGARKYSEAIDLWAVGCIFAEMFTKSPLFPGETDIDQLALVIKNLGTPTEENWPGHTTLPDFNKISFAPTKAVPWSKQLPDVPATAIDLIKSFVKYNSRKRMTAKEALSHKYFSTPPNQIKEVDLPRPLYDHRLRLKSKDFDFSPPQEIFQDCDVMDFLEQYFILGNNKYQLYFSS